MHLIPAAQQVVLQLAPPARSRLGALLAAAFGGMRAEFGANSARIGVHGALVLFAINFLGRVFRRLDRLALLWETGRLPPARPSRPHTRKPAPEPSAEPSSEPSARPLRMPSRKGWLVRAGYHFCAYSRVVERVILADPDFARFLAEVPQAGRILRPFCRLLAIPLPAAIRPAPSRRTPRPRKPSPTIAEIEGNLDHHYRFSEVPPKFRFKHPWQRRKRP